LESAKYINRRVRGIALQCGEFPDASLTPMSLPDSPQTLRLDRWLWCARFYRSRSLAHEAVAGGLVHLNGERTKPAHGVRVGDVVTVTRGDDRFEVQVLGIPARRGPAPEARQHFEETATSLEQREARAAAARLAPVAPGGRPAKHDRRLLRRLRGR
jgi:ribosome-associated heat shock protein Hsp15